MQVPHLVAQAAQAALTHPGPGSAATLYEAGRTAWSGMRFAPTVRKTWDDLKPEEEVYVDAAAIERHLDQQVVMDLETIGGTQRHMAEAYLRAAYAADPRMVRAGRLLCLMMTDQRRFLEAVSLGLQMVRATADSGTAWAALGMAQARSNQWRDAQASFDSALRKMSPDELAPYLDIGVLLAPRDSFRFESLDGTKQNALRFQFWGAQQPLFLTDLNEARTEFYTRLTHENIRLADRERAMPFRRYFNTDLAVRYGPVAQHSLYPRSRLHNFWLYLGGRTEPVDLFGQARVALPSDFGNIPLLYDMDTVDVQTAQFRGDAKDTTDVAVFTFAPAGRMSRTAPHIQLQIINALFIKDALFRDVQRVQDTVTVMGGDTMLVERRRARFQLAPSQRLLRAESYLPVIGRAARNQTSLDVRSFAGDTLLMSDVVMAGNLVPKDSTPKHWTDFFMEPSSGRLQPHQTVGLLWEIYNLVPDTVGVVRYHVELRVTVKDIERHGILSIIPGTIGDWLGLSAKGDDAAALGYNRQARLEAGGRQVEYLTLNLGDAPNGEYEVEVQITDRITGRVVDQVRRLIITPTPLTR
jgi:hypothetical protein